MNPDDESALNKYGCHIPSVQSVECATVTHHSVSSCDHKVESHVHTLITEVIKDCQKMTTEMHDSFEHDGSIMVHDDSA